MHFMTSHWKFKDLFTVQGGKGWCLVWSAIERSSRGPSLPPCSHCSLLLLCACMCSLPCSCWENGIRQIPQFWKRERSMKPGQMRVGVSLLQQQTFRSAQLSCETLSWNSRDWWKLLILHLSTGYRRSPDTTVMKGPAVTQLTEFRASLCKVWLPTSSGAADWDDSGSSWHSPTRGNICFHLPVASVPESPTAC